ncbi:RNA polymerase I-specific transcription initiation factor rrn7 [Trametes pubescens]|uniref:RNA polymerase I-specific transcription initiation factor rrn7 n=1 Tax=Trametes pubescens TaxID=154538 RepID=A0A1M2V860_TRAPU|nr:RNA polymerase I-specific transcription initiation factor rrn7 [Trametes pubescens]
MAPRRKCHVCGSKQWHKEPTSGIVTCSEGHVLQNYRTETHEVTELGPHAVRKRTLKSGRKKKERQSKADPKLYHGERARFHYFQCLQVLFRMQISALIRLWELPPEFELICRDIWALNLALLPNPPTPEPLLHALDGSEQDHASKASSSPRPSPEADEQNEREERADGSDADQSSSSSGSSSVSESDDEELEELMRENSETPSDDDDEPTSTPRPRPTARRPRKRRTFGHYDTPASTVSCLVVACWTLRLPVMYVDFVRSVESYELPYLDPLRLLPESMTSHLRKHTVQALSPHHPPSPLYLHQLASRLARLMYSTYDIYTPEMNAAPILWKSVRCLHGNPLIYVLTKRLARLVSIPLTLHRSLAPALVRTKKRDPTFHKQDSAVPEVALVSAVIVVMKMAYGLDGSPRHPQNAEDPACALPVLSELIRAIRNAEETREAAVSPMSTEHHSSVLDMDDQMLDDYLQFCEKALLPREDRMPARNVTTTNFPLPENPVPRPTDSERVGSAQADADYPGMNANTIDDSADALRPGQKYPVYNTQDILGTVPEDLELVVARAASWAGVDEDYILGVVERFERRVLRWWENVKRKERHARSSASE